MEHEEDHLDINFIYVKRNLHSLDSLLDFYVDIMMECKDEGGLKEAVHMLIEDLYPIIENDIIFNDILEKVKYLNKNHIVKDID